MPYLKEDVNFYLLLFIGIGIVVVVALVLFFSQNFLDINARYDAKIAELKGAFGQLGEKEGELSKTAEELKLKQEREEKLSDLYSGVKSEKEGLEEENSRLAGQNEQYQQMVEERDDLIGKLQRNMTVYDNKIDDLQAFIESLKNDINKLKSQGCTL